jgi:thymidylate synthase (FAD)
MEHGHVSPFEMANVCLQIDTTRDIGRQILRHRSFSFQEFSQRYADVTALTDWELRECRLQDLKNRQNSIDCDDEKLRHDWYTLQERLTMHALNSYRTAIAKGIAKEQARALLPEGLTPSRLYMNGTLRSWIHFIDLRSGNGTQLEHMEVARECAKVIAEIFPMATEYVQPQ